MGRSTFKGPVKSVNGFEFGEGTQITYIKKGTVSVNPASITNAEVGETEVTITGAATGDVVIMQPPAAGLTAGLVVVGAYVSAANTVKLRLFNGSAAPINEAATDFIYILIRS